MNDRCLAVGLTVIIAALSAASPASAQNDSSRAGQWTVSRTADGQPDLRGIWDFRTITPMERPEELAGKKVLTREEAAQYEQQTLSARDKDLRASDGISTNRDVANAYNQFWWDYGDRLTEDRRTSLIVDPPDGRIPWTPMALEDRQERAAARAAEPGGRITPGPEDRGLAERCILGFNSGPPMVPSAYNNNFQLVQTSDTVVIVNEMVHNARIVPMDGRPHLSEDVRQWVGDSRGRWEGDTLVVETTNFLGGTSFQGSSEHLHLVERFTRVDADTLLYEFTVEDSRTWTTPWTAAVPMTKTEGPMYEYACHEGNYGMTNLLAGSRAQERTDSGRPR
jgi:hypothetical protein